MRMPKHPLTIYYNISKNWRHTSDLASPDRTRNYFRTAAAARRIWCLLFRLDDRFGSNHADRSWPLKDSGLADTQQVTTAETPTSTLDSPLEKNGGSKSWLSRSRAWISIVLLTPAGFFTVFSTPYLPNRVLITEAFVIAGWMLFLAGAWWRWWATLYIGGRKGFDLVRQGPYSLSRNPLYFGTFLITISIAVMFQSLVFALAVLASSILYLMVTVPREEYRLELNHGKTYTDYRSRVPMFFPRFSLYDSAEEIVVNTNGLRAEFLRSLRWVCVPLICHILVLFRMQPWWPHLLQLP